MSKEKWENDNVRVKLKCLEKTCPHVTLPTTQPTEIGGLVWHPRPRGERPVSKRLSYETVVRIVSYKTQIVKKNTHKKANCLPNIPATDVVLI
jgi:hypothetical protein